MYIRNIILMTKGIIYSVKQDHINNQSMRESSNS